MAEFDNASVKMETSKHIEKLSAFDPRETPDVKYHGIDLMTLVSEMLEAMPVLSQKLGVSISEERTKEIFTIAKAITATKAQKCFYGDFVYRFKKLIFSVKQRHFTLQTYRI